MLAHDRVKFNTCYPLLPLRRYLVAPDREVHALLSLI